MVTNKTPSNLIILKTVSAEFMTTKSSTLCDTMTRVRSLLSKMTSLRSSLASVSPVSSRVKMQVNRALSSSLVLKTCVDYEKLCIFYILVLSLLQNLSQLTVSLEIVVWLDRVRSTRNLFSFQYRTLSLWAMISGSAPGFSVSLSQMMLVSPWSLVPCLLTAHSRSASSPAQARTLSPTLRR